MVRATQGQAGFSTLETRPLVKVKHLERRGGWVHAKAGSVLVWWLVFWGWAGQADKGERPEQKR